MASNITLGQFFPGNSFIHKLDPRVKIISLVVLLIAVFLSTNYLALAINLISAIIFAVMTKISAKTYFKSMKFILFIVLFTSLLNVFYARGTQIFRFGPLVLTKEGLDNSIFVAMRLIILILISSILTFTTSSTDLTYALEKLMNPLSIFKLKTHDLAMMMTISLRFIPTLFEETEKIIDAQKARGANMESGKILTRIKAFVPILVPLLVSSFKRAYDLAIAMECRCYNGGEGRTRLKTLHINSQDIFAIILVLAIFILVLLSNMCF